MESQILNLSLRFGPEQAGRLASALLLILGNGLSHKDSRQDTVHWVCCWHHVHWLLLCSVFAAAMQVNRKLSQNTTIDFFHRDRDKGAGWWEFSC